MVLAVTWTHSTELTLGIVAGKSLEEIRQHFNFDNDLTEEELQEIRRENQWSFE